jgi:myo-inositol-1(or 4)-monophosphatase
MNIDLEKILSEVILISKKAGLFIKNEKANFNRESVQYKGKNDLVSYVDITSEQMITEHLMKVLPGSGILAEEEQNNKEGEIKWVIDPLDGTTNFIHSIPVYAVSIGLLEKDNPILGVVYDPERDECFWAIKGRGAYLNENKITCSDSKSIKGSIVGTGFPTRDFSRRKEYLSALHDLMEFSHGVRRMGSAAIDLCYVACGRLDAFFEYNLKPWDVAAGALICAESGCNISDFKGENNWLYGKEIVVSSHGMFREFQSFVKSKFIHE